MIYKRYIKSLVDVVLAIIAFIILSPLFMVTMIVLAIFYRESPFFLQKRPGKDEVIFKIIKFKTMFDIRDEHGELLSDGKRLTPMGKFVRKTSLDEIPQLINVIKGDMSLIGPRPLLIEYLPLYNTEQKRRHSVKPGITGWAQVNGRNAISWKKKFIYDVWYVDNVSLMLDIKIIFKTISKVIKSEGINEKNQVTTTNFKGNE